MYKYELHLHTAEGSKCATSNSCEYLNFYKDMGYTGVVVTDHFYLGNTRPDRSLPWKDYMESYLSGYYRLKNAAEGNGLDVFFGTEMLFANRDEYLIYGLEPEWYIDRPELKSIDRIEFFKEAKKDGALIIQAHPYRYRSYYSSGYITIASSFVDGYEVFNSCNTKEQNKLALMLAQRENKIMIGGSDRHSADNSIKVSGGIILDKRVSSLGELIGEIANRNHKVMGVETLEGTNDDIPFDLPIEFV